MSRAGTLGWVVLLAASAVDAIHFGGDSLPIVVTPFLVLSAACGLGSLFALPTRQRGELWHGWTDFVENCGLLAAFVVIATLSAVFTERDSLGASIPRLFYLYWIAGFALLFARRTSDRLPSILLQGTTLFIVADVVFLALQSCSLFFEIPILDEVSVTAVGDVFRLSGLTGDPNRAALNLILMVGLRVVSNRQLGRPGIGGWPSLLAMALSVVTLSRSGLMGLAALLVTLLLTSPATLECKLKRLGAAVALTGLLGLSGYMLISRSEVFGAYRDAMVSDPVRENSTSIHLALLDRGAEMMTADAKTFLIGKGWGTEYEYTKDYFRDSKSGNFHSMFFSILVQCGFIGLAPFLLFLVRPWWRGSRWTLLVPVILLGGVFYQMHGEPFWWIVVVLMNSDRGVDRRCVVVTQEGVPCLA